MHSVCRGERKIYVTGVLFLHRISDNRFSHDAQRISAMLKVLCGDGAMPHLMLCTTMWDTVSPQEGSDRLDELCKTDTWMEMISLGADTAKMSNVGSKANEEAERIVGELVRNRPTVELAIQDEMVNQAKDAVETSAGRVLVEGQKEQHESDKQVKQLVRARKRRSSCVIQ